MSDEIVSRLMKRNRSKLIIEDLSYLNEADEDEEDDFEDAPGADEEYASLTDEEGDEDTEVPEDSEEPIDDTEEEEEHDDSMAPIQGSPDDSAPSSHGGPMKDFGGEEEEPEEAPAPEEPKEEEQPTEYENPLDNQYAVKFTLGDEVSLTATGTKNSDLKSGVIEGYDPEGFYKVKWSDESVTNGLTDIALAELVKTMKESKCVCGCNHFVEEDGKTVCDKCGRKLNESKEDPLMLADKSRPKGKRMIRSEAHPVSTANRPNISMAEAIRKALRGQASIREEDDPEIEENAFDSLKTLDNEFWTRQNEMQEDIEDLGYTVDEINNEYVVVSSDKDEENAYLIPISGTSRTMTLDFSKARMI